MPKKHRHRRTLEQTEPLAGELCEPQEAPSPVRWMEPVEPHRPAPSAELHLLRIGPPAQEADRSPPIAPSAPSGTTTIFCLCSVEQAIDAGEEKARPAKPDRRNPNESRPKHTSSYTAIPHKPCNAAGGNDATTRTGPENRNSKPRRRRHRLVGRPRRTVAHKIRRSWSTKRPPESIDPEATKAGGLQP